MKDNIMTKVSEDLYKHLEGFDNIVKDIAGDLPFGIQKMTPKDRRARIENLDLPGMVNLIKTHGKEAVEKELGEYYEGRI
ncbi:MAG TPA: hypothetical protein VMW45_00700 [Dehalococcoidia bacterium]|nr:hypothetical protein [Dehalococcoidia bacterium]